ncbi:MAG: endonuclease III [Christensenellales bacterium]
MRVSERTKEILQRLDDRYGLEIICSLDYTLDLELLVATMLSAQCTDERVNIVTKDLFARYKNVSDFANADIEELEHMVKPTGFFRAKAAHIKEAAMMIMTEHGGKVPDNIDDLTKLPGVGRKTANVILTHIYNVPGIVVDTHVKRITGRLGLTKERDPVKIEFDLYKKLPKEHWGRLNYQLITFGREICTARSPMCGQCFMADICKSKDKRI